jgi:hypothetical protein
MGDGTTPKVLAWAKIKRTQSLYPLQNIMLPPHIAEHSPRDLESGCEDSVLALARRMFGIPAE